MPDSNILGTAVEWLRNNEGDNGKHERCCYVADWIEYLENERMLRDEAKKAGVPVAALRRKLAAIKTGV
jgi:hypothetical protein